MAGITPYYEDGNVTIYNADCREVLPFLDPVDLLLTDPPYGIDADKNKRANKRHGKAAVASRDYGVGDWDGSPPPRWLLDQAIAKARYAIVFGGNYFDLPPSQCWLVWDKDNGNNGYADCELAWSNLPMAVRRMRYRWMGMLQEHAGWAKEDRLHPTQKPLDVMRWALLAAPDDCAVVLDPFMGSGTTLRAAVDCGRKAIGIERDESYCEAAVTRLGQVSMGFGA